MSSIDERVVQMKFDNAQFESKIAQTRSTLEKFKSALNLDSATKSVENLDDAGKRFSLAGMANGIEHIGSKFTALGVIGVTALASITTKAVDAGLQIAKSLTVDPIKSGFDEYELKMGSIQTILANTAKHGTKLKDVNAALNELNEYADKTIYNFGAMTENIGLFTNAGIKLEDAVGMIKGFSNEAAASGTAASEAARAAYQLSQSLSSGKITLETWNSLTNVGMGNKNMQTGLVEIADAMDTFKGKGIDATKAGKDFNKSLEKGWLTADVMQNYLKIQAGELNAEQMSNIGLTGKQISAFQKQQKTAEEAATKVRTFTGLFGTMQESVGSGWSETMELLIGDFDQATELWTNVNNRLGGIIGAMSDARNHLLEDWNKLGGRTVAIDAVKNAFEALMAALKPIGEAFREIFPPTTGKQLFDITVAIRDFTKSLMPSTETLEYLKRTFKGVFAVLDIGRMIVVGIAGVFGKLFGAVAGGGSGFLSITANIGDFLVRVRDAIKNGEGLTKFFDGLGNVLQTVVKWLRDAATWIGNLFGGMDKIDTSGVASAAENVKQKMEPLKVIGEVLANLWKKLGEVFATVMNFFKPMAKAMGDFFGDFGQKIGEAMKTLNFGDVLALVNTGLLAGLVLLFKKFLGGGLMDQIKEAIFGDPDEKGPGFMETIKETIGGLTDTLKTMQTTLKAATLVMIAGAIALLTASIVVLSRVDSEGLKKALTAMSVMFTQLMVSMAILDKMNISTGVFKMGAIGGAMIMLAIAIRILAGAVEKLSGLSWQELLKGLLGVTALMAGLAGAMNLLPSNPKKMISTGIGMIALAVGVKILASAVKDLSGLSWKELAKGLGSVGVILGALGLFTRLVKVNKGAIGSSIGLILLGAALKIIATVVKDLSAMSMDELNKGLGSIIAILGMVAGFSRTINPSMILTTSVAMVVLGAALKIIASALKDFSGISWEELGRGLLGMGAALAMITLAMNLMPGNMITTAVALVVVAAGLKIIASALKDMGGMSWEEIGKSMVMLAGSLAILSGAMALMGFPLVMAGTIGILASAAAMMMLVPALTALGKMSWDEIGRGLTMLAASLAILAVMGILIIPAAVGFTLLGAAAIMLGTGMVLAGIGMTAFAVALTALSVAGGIGISVMVGVVTALVGLIPMAMAKVGEGILAFALVISQGGPAIVAALVTVLLSLLQAIVIVTPQIVSTLWGLVQLLVTTLVNGIPWLVDAGMRLIIGILDGIARNIGQVVNSATDVIVNFINGITNNLPRITQAGADLIITFINSLADTVRNNSTAMGEAGGNLASAMIEGMVNGIGAGVGRIVESAKNMASQAFEAAKDFLNINSPSKKFRDLGESTGEGYMVGMDNYETPIRKSAENMGQTAMTSLQKSMSKYGSGVSVDMNLSPRIKPVIDLTNVRKGAASIGGMLQPPKLTVEGAYHNASSLAGSDRTNREAAEEARTKTGVTPPAGDTITYNQYNQSPKALSSAEIYRKTNNQMSQLKKRQEAKA